MYQKKSQKTECERSPDNPKRWRICLSCGRWSSKLSGRDNEFKEPTLRREYTVRRENLGGESTWRIRRWRKSSINNFGLFKDTSFVVIMLNREFNLCAERRTISYFQDFYYWIRCGGRIGVKPKHLRQKQIQLYWYCREGPNSVQKKKLCARIRSDEKISRKLFT